MASVHHLSTQIQKLWDRADKEGRPLSTDERFQIEQLVERVEQAKAIEDQLAPFDTGVSFNRGIGEPTHGQGLGDQFIESKGYKSIQDAASRGQNWSTGAVELETKGTLLTSPGTAITPAGYTPGIVQTLFQRPYLADLIPTSQAPGNPVRFVSESTATNAAAAVAEAGLKPESTLAFSETSEPVRKVATFLPISDELLEDAPQIQSYLNSRLSLFVQQQEEVQLLLGSGVAPSLQGLVGTGRTIGTYARGTTDSNAVAVFKAANGVRGSSFLDPDTVVIHPTNWQAIRLATDSAGQFLDGGPSLGAYGNANSTSANQFSAASLWGLRVVVTSATTVGTALVSAVSARAPRFGARAA
jgi:HK97 family phage major capsid protein